MRIIATTTANGKPTGYTMWLSAANIDDWRHRPGESWPCSTLARLGRGICVQVDRNGLCDFTAGRRNTDHVDGTELDAIVSDHLPAAYRHLWPVWA